LDDDKEKDKEDTGTKEGTKAPEADKSKARYEDDPENYNPFQKSALPFVLLIYCLRLFLV